MGDILPCPPVGTLVLAGDTVWRVRDHEQCSLPDTSISVPWSSLFDYDDDPVRILVPVPVDAPDGAEPALGALVEGVLQPVGQMMLQLAQAATAGLRAVVGEAYRRGLAAREPVTDQTTPPPGPGKTDALPQDLEEIRARGEGVALRSMKDGSLTLRECASEIANEILVLVADDVVEPLWAKVDRLHAELAKARAMPGLAEDCACKIDSSDCPGHHQCQPPSCQCTWCCADMSHCQNTSPPPASTTREA